MGDTKISADVAMKEFWRNEERFADLFNGTVFAGNKVLQPEQLQEMDTDVSGNIEGSQYFESMKRNRDVVKKMAFGIEFAILAVENQQKINYTMSLRIMGYDELGYQKELSVLRNNNQKKHILHTGEELLSGIKKSDRLHPIITIVLSYAEDFWDGPLCLKDMMVEMPEQIEKVFSDYKMNLVEIRKSGDYIFHNEDVRMLFDISKHIYEREYDQMNKEYKDKTINPEMLRVIGAVTGSRKLEKLGETQNNVEGRKMCRALEELREDGIREGRESGLREGREEYLKELVCLKIKKGKTPEQIAEELETEVGLIKDVICRNNEIEE